MLKLSRFFPILFFLTNFVEAQTITIGKQVWMTKNLNVDKFRNGDPIPEVKNKDEWEKAGKNKQPAWCYYNNDVSNGVKYGKLYNWYAVNDPRGLAPRGWHVPTDAEWNILIANLDPSYNPTAIGIQSATAGGKMKSTGTQYWISRNTGATNSSGWSGLPGGFRLNDEAFVTIGYFGTWWSSTESSTYHAWGRDAWCRYLVGNNGAVRRDLFSERIGLSVRCLRD